MKVSAILKGKSQSAPALVTIASNVTLLEAARKLAQHKIGAVVVAAVDGTVAGILSERDIVRRLAEAGPDVLSAPVRDVMTRNVVTCTPESSVDELMAKMTRGRFRHLPVVDAAGHLTGIVSIGDVVKVHVEEIEHEATALREYISTH